MEVIFQTKTYKGDVNKGVKVFYEPYLYKRIELKSHVYSPRDTSLSLSINPYKLDFSQYSQNSIREKILSISNNTGNNNYISIIDQPSELDKLDINCRLKPYESIFFEVKLSEDGFRNEFEKSLTIQLHSINKLRFTIPIKRTIRVP